MSISKHMIEESARNKYVEQLSKSSAEESKKYYQKMKEIDDKIDSILKSKKFANRKERKEFEKSNEEIAKLEREYFRLDEKRRDIIRNGRKYINDRLLGDGSSIDDEIALSQIYSNKRNIQGNEDRRRGAENFKKDFGGPEGSDLDKKISGRGTKSFDDIWKDAEKNCFKF